MKTKPSGETVAALNQFFADFGTRAAYCVDLDDDGEIKFIVCFGENFTNGKLKRLLLSPSIAEVFHEVPEVRLIATKIDQAGVHELQEVNPRIKVLLVSSAEWENSIDEFNRLRKIRYGRWPKPNASSKSNASGPTRYGLDPKRES